MIKANLTDPLTSDMVTDPKMYRLALSVSDTDLDIIITSRVRDNELIHRHISFGDNADIVSALEEAIYDNPLLTSDFHSVDIVVDNKRFFVIDAAQATDEEIRRRIGMLWPDDRESVEYVPLRNAVEDGRTEMVTVVPRRLLAFMRRTWNNPRVVHRLAVLARYYGHKNSLGNMGKIYARTGAERVDIIAYGRDGLLMANTFATPGGTEDAAYYVMAAAKNLDFDRDTDRIYVGGPYALRDALVGSLRRFVPFIMPEIIPAVVNTLADGNDNMPFEPLLLPLI